MTNDRRQLSLGAAASASVDTVPEMTDRSTSRASARSSQRTAVSLFTGAGGLDLGCEAAGFRTLAAVEFDEVAQRTLLANRADHFVDLRESMLFSDIVTLDYEELLDAAGLAPGEVDLLHGGPPCTPFSKSGYWLAYKRAGEDPKASLLDNYVAALEAIKPKAFLMENVYGLAYQNQNRPILERFMAGARGAGYSVDHRIILAADHGVPQLRQRLFCVGIRSELLDQSPALWEFRWPEETHAGPHERRTEWDESLTPHLTAGEALAGLAANPPEPEEIVEGTYADALREVPPGDNYLFLTAKRGHPRPQFEWRSRYWSFLLKLHPDRPSPTIQGQPGPWVGPFHWEDRRLRVAELKRLMTFPDHFVVEGTRREQQLQLGNAVPPLLAERVATATARELGRLEAGEALAVAA
ncbi:MAG: cytosine-specific methyltransferase [Actinomycetes bacterium]|nr:MAG: cytosine-specific methyltransferase [Actinomycetes bacterium]